jgi:Na+/melibiose symporter-like transporter
VIDQDEVEHNTRREGLILGVNAFFNKIGESIGPIIGTSILLLFTFQQKSEIQGDLAIVGIKFLLFIVQGIFIAIGAISLYYFPLYGEKLQKLRAELSKMHKEKTDAFRAKL